MTAFIVIAASVAVIALVAGWLWTRPDIRDRLLAIANRLRPSTETLKWARWWLAPLAAVGGLVALFTGELGDALKLAAIAVLARMWDRAERQADMVRTLARLSGEAENKAEQARDSTLDAIAKLVAALESDQDYDVEAALDAAKWVLEGGDYTGRLRAVQNAHDAAEEDLRYLRARLAERGLLDQVLGVDDARLTAILAATADRVEPGRGIDAIRARVNGSKP